MRPSSTSWSTRSANATFVSDAPYITLSVASGRSRATSRRAERRDMNDATVVDHRDGESHDTVPTDRTLDPPVERGRIDAVARDRSGAVSGHDQRQRERRAPSPHRPGGPRYSPDRLRDPVAVAHRRHLGQDRDRDLRRRPRAVLQSDRPVQAGRPAHRSGRTRRAARGASPGFSGSRSRRRRTRRTSAPRSARGRRAWGSCVSATIALCASGTIAITASSGISVVSVLPATCHCAAVFLARVADRDRVVQRLRHLREVLASSGRRR